MSIKRGRWEGNEIILTADMNNNSDLLSTNVDELSNIIGATAIMNGMVVSELGSPGMAVQISKGIAKDNTVGTMLSGEAFTSVTIAAADGSNPRLDTIEIRRLKEEITPESRQVKDPISGNISVTVIDTEEEYKTEVKVLDGTPGSGIAVVSEPGWIKIAEILVPAASSTVVDANIYNVDAVKTGDSNTNWTANITDVYRNGSISDMKTEIVDNLNTFLIDGLPKYSALKTYIDGESFVQDAGMGWRAGASASGFAPSTNQDKWTPAVVPILKKIFNASGAIVFGFSDFAVEIDTSGGNKTINALPTPNFIGQKINFVTRGAGIGTLTAGTGIPFDQEIRLDKGRSIVSVEVSGALQWELLIDEKRICKAWANWNGTGVVAIRDEYNTSSITDNGVGNYTHNLINAMNDANYSALAQAGVTAAVLWMSEKTRTTSSIIFVTSNHLGASIDAESANVAIFGS